jgi:ankyrin repeat protein
MHEEALEAARELQASLVDIGDTNKKTHLDIDIHKVAKKGDVKTLAECLYLEPFCLHERKIRTEETPLHIAVEYGRHAAVVFLLESGADVKAATAQGLTALHKAAVKGDLECAKLLVEACIDREVEEADLEDDVSVESLGSVRRGRRSLKVEEGEKPIIEIPKNHIVACGLINAYDNDWLTPLHYACISGATEMVAYLLDCGSLPAIQSKGAGDDCLHLASFYGNTATVEHLLTFKGRITLGMNVLTRNKHGNTCLHRACERGHYETARYLQKQGANLLVVNDANETPIDLASPETIKYLTPLVKKKK